MKFFIPSYQHNHFIDWYIDEMNIVLELHGLQHYSPTAFTSDISYRDKMKQFHNLKYRDNLKKTNLEDSGYKYIEIPYNYEISANELKRKVLEQ